MTDLEKLETAVRALDSKKASDIKVLKVEDLTILADVVEFMLGEKGVRPKSTEGEQSRTWIVLDYYDIIIHVFLEETRDFYRLEHLWADGTPVDISEWVTD